MKILFLLFCPVLAWSQAYLPFTKNVAAKGYEFKLNSYLHQTKSTYSNTGESTALEEGESYQLADLDLYASYGYSRNLQFTFGTKFRNIDSSESGPTDSSLHDLNASGIHSGYVGARYAWDRVDNIFYTLEFGYRHFSYTNQIYKVAEPNAYIALGDDGQEFHLGLNITIQPKSSMNFITSKIFFRSRGSNMSDEIFYQVEGALVWRHFAMLAGIKGVNSLNNDDYSSDEANRPVIPSGPSKYLNAINPSYTDAYAGIAIAFNSKVKIELKGGVTVTGNNADQSQFAMANFIIRNDAPKGKFSFSSSFKDYSIDGEITKISPKKTYGVINRGLADGVTKGMRFDVYEDDFLGGNKLLASGIVVRLGASSAIIQFGNYYSVDKLREGHTVRGGR
jgi:hypothetical protein